MVSNMYYKDKKFQEIIYQVGMSRKKKFVRVASPGKRTEVVLMSRTKEEAPKTYSLSVMSMN